MPRPPLHHNAGITLIKRPHRARTARAPRGSGRGWARAGDGDGRGEGLDVLGVRPWGGIEWGGCGRGEGLAMVRVQLWQGSGQGEGPSMVRV